MRIIDTHAHLYDEVFREDIADVVSRAKGNGVEKIFLPNIDEASWPEMLRLSAEGKGFFYPMCGLHPTEVRADYAAVLDRMEAKRDCAAFIGIGEVGLDFYWDRTYEQAQKDAFVRQVEWAVAWHLPLMIHSRSAQDELMGLLSPYRSKGLTGVFHCFGGTVEEARELLEFDGFMLGINGIVTFKKSTLPDVLRCVPLERVVVETDAPYLAPTPFRGKRNESAFVSYVLARVADCYGVSQETVAEATNATVERIFGRLDNR